MKLPAIWTYGKAQQKGEDQRWRKSEERRCRCAHRWWDFWVPLYDLKESSHKSCVVTNHGCDIVLSRIMNGAAAVEKRRLARTLSQASFLFLWNLCRLARAAVL